MVDGRLLFAMWLTAVGASLGTLRVGVAPESHMTIPATLPDGKAADKASGEAVHHDDRPTRIARAADGLFYVDGEVNGTPIRFLVDSGATAIVLAPADAARAGIDLRADGRAATMRTSGGTTDMVWSTARRLSIAGLELRNADVAVPDGGLQISLLGQSALSRLGPMTFDGNVLTIGRETKTAATH